MEIGGRLGRGILLSSLGLVAISALVISGMLAGRGGSGGPTRPELGTPCGGTETSLVAAREAAVFDLVEPQAPLANPNNLTSVWACASVAGGIALVYDSGTAVLESVNDLKDPPAEWKGLADSYREFSVGDVNGIPASFADPAVDDAIGGVDLVVGDVRYTVSGNGKTSLEDLILVAQSLANQVT